MPPVVASSPESVQPQLQRGDVLVVFGISGDLAKVMTFRSLYRLERRGLLTCPIVGVAIDDWTVNELREHAHAAIKAAGERIEDDVFERLANRMSYVRGDFGAATTYEAVGGAIADASLPVFYLETPPALFATVVQGLSKAGLTKVRRRVPALPHRPLSRQDGPRRDPPSALPERDARAGLEP